MGKIKYKLIAALAITSFVCVCIISGYEIWQTVRQNENDVKAYRTVLLGQFDRTMKLQVEDAYSLVQSVYAKQQQGQLTEAAAQKQAADLVRSMRYDNGNYFWIDTTDGVNVVMLGEPIEGKSRWDAVDARGNKFIQQIIKHGSQAGGGYTNYWFPKPHQTKELPKRSYSLLFAPYHWVIGTGNWIDEIDQLVAAKQADNRRKLMSGIGFAVLIGLLAMGIAILIALYIAKKISAPVEAMSESVQAVAAGNLSVPDIRIDSRDELGVLANACNAMKNNLQGIIRQVASSASQVVASSQELTATSEQSAQAGTQVAGAITEVAKGAENQVQSVHKAAGVVAEISGHIAEISGKVQTASSVSEQAAGAAVNGEQALGRAIRQIESIEKTVTGSAAVVAKLGSRSQEIGQIVDAISGIAGQTNLLALNAAIEAARAGEQGRGFAVVAEEVRKLAEQSQGAAGSIADMIREIRSDTDQAVAAMQQGTEEVKTGAQVMVDAGRAFTEIAEMVQQVSGHIKAALATVQQVEQGSHKIVESIQEIEAVSRDTAAESETVSAATQQQSASMEEIAAASQSLSQLAEKLQDVIGKFRI
jgi:methyl-accepting chemotaxis protein